MVKSSGQTDTHRLLNVNFFGHAEVVASGLTLLQPIIKNVQTDTVIALQAQLRRLVNILYIHMCVRVFSHI